MNQQQVNEIGIFLGSVMLLGLTYATIEVYIFDNFFEINDRRRRKKSKRSDSR